MDETPELYGTTGRRQETYAAFYRRDDGMPLGAIGRSLALIYHDVLSAPLPPTFQRLVDELARELDAAGERSGREPRGS